MIHMVIADQEQEYIQRLIYWFRENKPNQFQISAFSEKESFEKFIWQSSSEVDVILASEPFLTADLAMKSNVIILGRSASDLQLPSIEKHQPASALTSAILSIVSQWHNELPVWNKPVKNDLIVCFSPDPRLKSTLALWLARCSPESIYINLESFPFYPLQPDKPNARGLSDILYHIKASRGNIQIALESAVYTDTTGIQHIPPMDNPCDLWELTGEETGILTEALLSWGRYSTIIADIECNTGPAAIKLLESASCILIPLYASQGNQILQLQNMLRNYPHMPQEKIKWVLAGEYHTQDIPDSLNSMHFLPWLDNFLPDWKSCIVDNSYAPQLEALLKA